MNKDWVAEIFKLITIVAAILGSGNNLIQKVDEMKKDISDFKTVLLTHDARLDELEKVARK